MSAWASRRSWGSWLSGRRYSRLPDVAAVSFVVLLAAAFTGVNMFRFPQFESDEGTYMGSAWSMFNEGQLSYYTYNYDHPPFGWFLIGGWAKVVGGFLAFGTSVATGRAFMWVVAILSTVLIYELVRRASGRRAAAILSATLFAVSPLGVDLHRQVWLDNLATFWLLVSIYLLLIAKGNMTRVLLSALAFGLSFWTKEVMAVFLPGMIALALALMHPAHRRFASVLWAATAASIMSLFVLLAFLKDELLPPGVLWSSSDAHVSLFDTYQWQMSRRGGAPFDPNSDFATNIRQWTNVDPVLAIGGSAAALIGLFLFRRNPALAGVSLLAISFLIFLGRGGQVLFYYVIPLIALLVIAVGLLAGHFANASRVPRFANRPLTAMMLAASILVTVSAADAKDTTFTANRTEAQRQAALWIANTLPHDSVILMDSYAWVDLRDATFTGGRPFVNAHYYWPGVSDPAVRSGLLHDDWRAIDYLAFSPSMEADIARRVLPLLPEALGNSDTIALFQSENWTVRINRIRKFQELEATADPLLVNTWESYKTRFIEDGRVVDPKDGRVTTSEGQAYALTRAVYMQDRKTFDQLWSWTRTHLQLRGDGLLSWRWGVRVPHSEPAAPSNPDPSNLARLRAVATKWARDLVDRLPTEPELNWMLRNYVPATDEHISAFYEQTRDGTVWTTDPGTYRGLRQRMQRIWESLGGLYGLPPSLVAQAIGDGWDENKVREVFASTLTQGISAWPRAPMTILDWNAATDADEDAALALLFASKQWGSEEYRDAALEILRGIWEQETAVAGGRRVVVAGNWARGDWSSDLDHPVVNPSYFAPATYRIFAQVDPEHPWRDLVDSSYDILARVHASPEMGGAAGLVPNWLQLDTTTGHLLPATILGDSARRFSHDASRIYWRLGLDWLWFKDDRARTAIDALSFPRLQLKSSGGILLAGYYLDGTPADQYEAISMYAATLPGLLFDPDKALAQRVFAEHILRSYVADPSSAHWGDGDDYFNQNWAWFATALMDGAMTNLWAGQRTMRLVEVLP